MKKSTKQKKYWAWIVVLVLLSFQIMDIDIPIYFDDFDTFSITEESLSESSQFLVTRVIDGDTIRLKNGEKVRYIGIDTPEISEIKSNKSCFSVEAKNENEKLVLGKVVRLEKDISEIDKYGRLLRYVYIDDIFVNEFLVEKGFATISTYPPDVKYADILLEAQNSARENGFGLWKDCLNN
ncbi:thermonuclease family protein [Patescibacteria group bacterium]